MGVDLSNKLRRVKKMGVDLSNKPCEVEMYWRGSEEYIPEFWKKEERNARKEHECCECRRTIPIRSRYLYFVGKWLDPVWGEPFFDNYKMCLSCGRDWQTVIAVFQENGEEDACVVFERLEKAIKNAFECGFLKEYDPLVQRWLPDVIESQTEEEAEVNLWKAIEISAVRKGLQPVLPGLFKTGPLTAS